MALHIFRTLKANLQRSASQILVPPGSSSAPLPHAENTINSQLQTEAKRQAEAAIADEKDKIAVADDMQRYIEQGVFDEEEYKGFSLTWYWQVSDVSIIHYFEFLKY